jgi:hypothetical protein
MSRPPFAHTIDEQIASLADSDEVDGAIGQLQRDGRMTAALANKLELQRAKVQKTRKLK